jgi:lipopolysaccharide transport system permease protein
MSNSNSSEFDLVIKPGAVEKNYWQDIWRFRELFYILTWRDLKVRYKQTVLGVAWSVLRPLLSTIIFSVLFGRIARLKAEVDNQYYMVFVFAAMLPWQFFSSALVRVKQQHRAELKPDHQNLLSPHHRAGQHGDCEPGGFHDLLRAAADHVWPFTAVGAQLENRLPARLPVAGLPGGLRHWPDADGRERKIPRLPVCDALYHSVWRVCVAGGLQQHDSCKITSASARLLYSLNPLVGVIDGFRWAIFGKDEILFVPGLMVSAGVTLIMLWVGIRYFRRTEKGFADTI